MEYPPFSEFWFSSKLFVERPNGRKIKFPKSFNFPKKKKKEK